jgi:HK97 gp10 family phage protein
VVTPQELSRKLDGLVENNLKTAMSRVVLQGEAIAKREAPVKTGNLRRTITSSVEAGGKRGRIGTNAKYARAVHEGTKPRVIKATKAKALFWPGARHPVKSVNHPGTRANPFFDRTMDRLRPVAERELSDWMDVTLRKVL